METEEDPAGMCSRKRVRSSLTNSDISAVANSQGKDRSLCLSVRVSVCLFVSLSFSLSLSLSVCLSVYPFLSLSASVCASLTPFVSLRPLCLSLTLCVSLSVSLSFSVSVSLCRLLLVLTKSLLFSFHRPFLYIAFR